MSKTELRTHDCGELRAKDASKKVVLSGWVHSIRYHGNVTFIDLRDRYGITQITFDEKHKEQTSEIKKEYVIQVEGKVLKKPEPNKNLETGDIEIFVDKFEILNESKPLPIAEGTNMTEETRLTYRFLDLRRPVMQKKLMIRHKAAQATREYLSKNNFMEIETPMLIRATPEGARDYVVPSRVHKGKFYSLPQSPQLYKQILMVSGMDRYFQLARCLRDEDLREDRQPEFTQIDMEMSFVDEEDVYKICEGLMKHIWKETLGIDIKIPFPRMTYEEAMTNYGIDKPDLRFGLELIDVTEVVKKSDFKIFNEAEQVVCLNPEKEFSRKEVDKYSEICVGEGAKGMAWVKVTEKGFDGGVSKFLSEEVQKELLKVTKAKNGSTLMFVADKTLKACEYLGKLRNQLGRDLELIKEGEWKFIWVTRWPLFEAKDGGWTPMHHIFSMPHEEFIGKMSEDPGKVTGKLYDLALNGTELGGGSIRIHRKDIQEEALKVIGMDYKEAEKRFGFLLNAFKYGAPPHGGLAFGFDRVCALLNGTKDIREVIAFPKNKNAENPMDGCPTEIDQEQLDELTLEIKK